MQGLKRDLQKESIDQPRKQTHRIASVSSSCRQPSQLSYERRGSVERTVKVHIIPWRSQEKPCFDKKDFIAYSN